MSTRALWLSVAGVMAGAVACSSGGSSVSPGSGGSGTGGASTATGGRVGSGGGTGSGGAPDSTTTGGTSGGVGTGGSGTGGSRSGGNGGAVGSATGGRAAGGTTGGTGGAGPGPGGSAPPPTGFAVVTDRYDMARSGSNMQETILTTSNVTPATFGLLFSRTIVGDSYSQPLYVGGLTVNGAQHNVVYVVTERNMVYAFDADAVTPDVPLWSKSLGTSMTLGAGADYDPTCTDMRREVGITSTPVISLADGKIFVVAKTATDQQLHALDLATGAEGVGSPISVGRTAMPAFDPRIHLNRPALLMLNGTVFIAYGSHCDQGAYHGWIFGYDAKTLALKIVYNTTPSMGGNKGAIWQSGAGISSNGTDIFAAVGNGSASATDMGNNVVRLTPTANGLTVAAHYASPINGDNDLQSTATLLGTTGQVVGGGKDGDILLLGQADMALRQRVSLGGEVNAFAFWNGSAGPTLFAWTVGNSLRAYRVGTGSLTAMGVNSEQRPAHPSAIFTVSSNGTMAGTGILWASVPLGDAWHMPVAGRLYAFDAANVASPSLWSSPTTGADSLGTFAKYSPPIVANGKVYVATFSGKLQVYGLK